MQLNNEVEDPFHLRDLKSQLCDGHFRLQYPELLTYRNIISQNNNFKKWPSIQVSDKYYSKLFK